MPKEGSMLGAEVPVDYKDLNLRHPLLAVYLGKVRLGEKIGDNKNYSVVRGLAFEHGFISLDGNDPKNSKILITGKGRQFLDAIKKR